MPEILLFVIILFTYFIGEPWAKEYGKENLVLVISLLLLAWWLTAMFGKTVVSQETLSSSGSQCSVIIRHYKPYSFGVELRENKSVSLECEGGI